MKRLTRWIARTLDARASIIEGSQRDWLYPSAERTPATPLLQPEFQVRATLARQHCERVAAERCARSTSVYMTSCEVTTLLIANK